jgi:putative MATE family efflux protein
MGHDPAVFIRSIGGPHMQVFVNDRDFYRRLREIAVPITLQGLVNFGVNMVDTVVMGSLGEVSLSAVSLANQFCFLFMILNFGLGGGAGVLTGQFWGKGDRESIGKTLSIVYKITAALAFLFFIAAQFFPDTVMSLYTRDTVVIAQGSVFLRVISWSYLLQGISTISAIVLRTVGIVRLTLVTSAITLANTILMNWIFVFGNLGAPRMGTAGSALATSISRLLEFIVIAVYMLRWDKRIQFRLKALLHIDRAIFADYRKRGLPVLLSDLLLAVGMNIVAAIMGRIGRDFVSAYAIAGVVWQLTTVVLMGTSGASAVIIGNTVGERRYGDAQKYGVTFLAIGVLVGLFAGVIVFLLKDFAIGFYNVSEDTKGIARDLMSAIALLAVFSSVQMMLTKGVLRAGGDTVFLMVADVLFLWAASVPLGMLAAFKLGWPALLVLLCLKVDEVIKAVWCTARLFGKKWIRNVTIVRAIGEDTAGGIADAE